MYNSEKYILSAIESILNQEEHGLTYEIVVVDDGSKDNSLKLVCDLSNEKIKIVALEKNGGLSNARNEGMKIAEGEWLQFLDSDDKLDLSLFNYFEKRRDTNIDCFIYSIAYEYLNKNIIHNFIKAKDKRAFGHLCTACNKIIKREKCVQFKKGFLFEDVIFSVEMMKQELRLAILPDVLYHYNCHNNTSIIANFNAKEYIKMYHHIFESLSSYDLLTKMYVLEVFVSVLFDKTRPLKMKITIATNVFFRLFYLLTLVLFNQNRKNTKVIIN